MACFHPVTAWTARAPNEQSGKHSIQFRSNGTPSLEVPCGRCTGCRADKALMWSIRLYHESLFHRRNSFLTLTYADAPDELNKKHLQDFFKRARHYYKFRYFACGEYGEQTRRPHYHAVFFGENFQDGKIQINSDLYTNQRLADLWGHGQVSVGNVTFESCAYVAGYVHKKAGDEDTFNLMSSNPGLGKQWLLKYFDDVRRTGTVSVNGKEFPVPARYLAWAESELDDVLSDVKASRKRFFENRTLEEKQAVANGLPSRQLARLVALRQKEKKI